MSILEHLVAAYEFVLGKYVLIQYLDRAKNLKIQ